jgi:hypothetical protein
VNIGIIDRFKFYLNFILNQFYQKVMPRFSELRQWLMEWNGINFGVKQGYIARRYAVPFSGN